MTKRKPPYRPRGEKPATTIRLLRRELSNMEKIIVSLRLTIADKEKVIAGYDVQLAEANDEIGRRIDRTSEQSIRIGHLTTQLRDTSKQLAFLSGYYARSQEELGAMAPRETLTRRNPGNPPASAHAGQDRQGPRFEGSSEGWPSPDRHPLRDFEGISSLVAQQRSTAERDFASLTPAEKAFAKEMKERSSHEPIARAGRIDAPYRGIDGPL